MHRFLILVAAVFALALSKSTIDDTQKLFMNTIKKWNVQIRNKRDHSERYNRLVRMKRSVDETHSGVMLDALNRFAVNNDEEHEHLMNFAKRASNMTLQLNEKRSAEDEHKLIMLQERDARINLQKRDGETADHIPHPEEVDWTEPPPEYNFWEIHIGLSEPQHQHGCGSCWAFPTTGAMEAVYKKITGEFVKFSTQYFIDCSFSYSGCAGGAVNDGFKITKDRQYAMEESLWPLTTEYSECAFGDWIKKGEHNGMNKAWFQDFFPLGRSEEYMIKGLKHSPVAFGGYISENYFAYVNGKYDDALCAVQPLPHAQLLVGYTKDTLRVRGSYGTTWGDYGYINYARGSDNLRACRLFDHSYAIIMTERREMEYKFCNNGKPATRAVCRQSCKDMDTEGNSGWDLAVIPTVYHNNEILKMVNAKYPGVKSDEKFNLLWVGLSDPDKCMHYHWTDHCWKVNYFNYTRETKTGKFGLLDKNDGGWEMRSSTKFQARGVCSRAKTCFDITYKIEHGSVTFNTEGELLEGTVATISCDSECYLKGDSVITCKGGHWGVDDHVPHCVCRGDDGFDEDLAPAPAPEPEPEPEPEPAPAPEPEKKKKKRKRKKGE